VCQGRAKQVRSIENPLPTMAWCADPSTYRQRVNPSIPHKVRDRLYGQRVNPSQILHYVQDEAQDRPQAGWSALHYIQDRSTEGGIDARSTNKRLPALGFIIQQISTCQIDIDRVELTVN
jgi:hypothetical protein